MKKEELILYEAPSISEFISWDLFQNIIAKYIAWKINRKLKRYNYRVDRNNFIDDILSKKS